MHLTMKRKCLLARAFSRGRQCRVRAAGTVGGKAPGGCKAASDEGNYTMKRKCLLARAFSRGRQLRSRAKARKRQSRLILPSAKSLRILYHIFALFQALHSYFNFLRPAPTEYPPMSTAPNRTHLLRQFTELRITFSAYRTHLRLHLVNVPNSC